MIMLHAVRPEPVEPQATAGERPFPSGKRGSTGSPLTDFLQ